MSFSGTCTSPTKSSKNRRCPKIFSFGNLIIVLSESGFLVTDVIDKLISSGTRVRNLILKQQTVAAKYAGSFAHLLHLQHANVEQYRL